MLNGLARTDLFLAVAEAAGDFVRHHFSLSYRVLCGRRCDLPKVGYVGHRHLHLSPNSRVGVSSPIGIADDPR